MTLSTYMATSYPYQFLELQASVLSMIRIDIIQSGIELPEHKEYNVSSFIIILLRDGRSRITEIRTIKMILSMTIFDQQFSTKLNKYVIRD